MSLIQILSSFLVICILVVVHEFGHFIVAKWCGVGVLKFSVGFGPVLWSFRRKETTYQLCLIPLGGYVRMVGDISDVITGDDTDTRGVGENQSGNEKPSEIALSKSEAAYQEVVKSVIEDKNNWFVGKPLWQQAAVVFAGPFFNFLLAIFSFSLLFVIYGQTRPLEDSVIGAVARNRPAGEAGLRVADRVVSVEGLSISRWEELQSAIKNSGGRNIALEVERSGERLPLSVTPREEPTMNPDGSSGKAYMIGIQPDVELIQLSLLESVKEGALVTGNLSILVLKGVWSMVTLKASAKDIAGPLFIIKQAGKQAEKGFDRLLQFMAFLSISLAILNLLPIPVLDGGHLLFFALEGIFGTIRIRIKEVAQQVGAVFLIALTLFAVSNDLTRKSIEENQIDWDSGPPAKAAHTADVK